MCAQHLNNLDDLDGRLSKPNQFDCLLLKQIEQLSLHSVRICEKEHQRVCLLQKLLLLVGFRHLSDQSDQMPLLRDQVNEVFFGHALPPQRDDPFGHADELGKFGGVNYCLVEVALLVGLRDPVTQVLFESRWDFNVGISSDQR